MTNRNLNGQEHPSSTTGQVLIGRRDRGPVGTVKWKSIPKERTSIKEKQKESKPCRGSDRKHQPASPLKGPRQYPTEVKAKEANPPRLNQ
ncbi:hypothetical protein C922_05819 [Plasmodium inui San Antonio 1]|uniref:Uncharacterized protein n=1 Tax=Plasmodium inui San Antonio 1 TaxID=1237626 RepID=W7AEV8_9APIC|nr:hypothetical protein C922_05819 [Plasmodium inui San Antonio 1]EUD63801.1 hypothetical protein C922_05819 [Plasmodium inui San Antonio 1]